MGAFVVAFWVVAFALSAGPSIVERIILLVADRETRKQHEKLLHRRQ